MMDDSTSEAQGKNAILEVIAEKREDEREDASVAVDKNENDRFRSQTSGQGVPSPGARAPGPQKDTDSIKKLDTATPKGS